MHELSLAHSIIEIVEQEAEAHHLARVTRIQLKVGSLRSVVPALMHTAMAAVTRDTVADGAELELSVVKGRARCRACGHEFPVDDLLFLCPECEAVGGEIVQGDELLLMEMDGE